MASPKSKTSRSRRGSRRAHNALKPISTAQCPNCFAICKTHHVCPSCGYYKDHEITHATESR